MRDTRFEIEPMGPGDIREVAEIERLAHASPWPERLFADELAEPARQRAHIDLVRAREPGGAARVVGFCNYWLVSDEIHLLNLATHPDWRRRGIATMLMRRLLEVARARACHCVTLEVRTSNHPARALYQALGFTSMGTRPRYYEDNGEDAVIMTLHMDSDP